MDKKEKQEILDKLNPDKLPDIEDLEVCKKQKREAILLAKKKRLQRQRVGNRPMPKTLK